MELEFIKDMFDAIAGQYDLLNRMLSLRQDVYWRRMMISALNLKEDDCLLDVACGTGDVILEILKQQKSLKRIVGLDFSPQMLRLSRDKLNRMGKAENVNLVLGNGLSLPFLPNTFDAITIAFGIRNIVDRKKALTVFMEHLKPGGTLAVLELATPENRFFQSLYLFYFKRLVPKIGAVFTKHLKAYTYLPKSVIHFPAAREFAKTMHQAGFIDIKWRPLTFGIAVLFIGYKSPDKFI